MEYSINIIGHGYVGGAMSYVCDKNNIVYNVCDTKYINDNTNNKFHNVKDLCLYVNKLNNKISYYFICVPTPSKDNGECNTDIVINVIKE